MLSPGRYLSLRRGVTGMSVLATASALVGLPAAIRSASAREINRMADRLHAAEADEAPLTVEQIRLVAEVIPVETATYLRLSAAHVLGINAFLQICEGCGCTDTMACVDDHGPCSWSHNQPDLCTACERPLVDLLVAAAAQASPMTARRAL